LLPGCARNITISPTDISISKPNSFNIKVGYVISQSELNKEVITPAGGGDKVKYKPYQALATGLNLALKQIFLDAVRLDSISQISNYSDIALLFDPTIIKTDSSSSSYMFWPPENFTLQLDCYIYDRKKNQLQKIESIGYGSSSKSDWFGHFDKFGIAGQRAMRNAIEEMFAKFDYNIAANFTKGNSIAISKDYQEAQNLTARKYYSKSNVDKTSKKSHWAIVIGISKYQHYSKQGLANLIFADDDAKAFTRTLQSLGWNDSHIKLLLNEEATERNIKIALEAWLTKAGPNDQIVLFWAGHGFPDPEDPEKVYFACYDTDIKVPATGYRMDRVRTALKERKAKNVIVLADTCHAGKIITRGNRGVSILPNIEKMRREQNIPKGWIFMVGADTDRQAIEDTSWANGAFTHSLIKGLSGKADGFQSAGAKDGIVTMGELKDYMNTAMPDETQKVLGVAKRPIITTSTGDPDIWNLTLQVK